MIRRAARGVSYLTNPQGLGVFRYAALAVVLTFGCGSESEQPPGEPELNFAKIRSDVMTLTNCGGPLCHDAAVGSFSLGSADQLYAELVGKMAAGSACGTSGLTRVVPSDSASSLLYLKLSHTQPCGDPMPLLKLSDDKIELVRRWIDEGAKK